MQESPESQLYERRSESREIRELRLLQTAGRVHWWRWRSEKKRLERGGMSRSWELHLKELCTLHRVWTELRAEEGLGLAISAKVIRARDQVFYRKWRRYMDDKRPASG